jgi:hypothetical protein
LNRIRLFAGLQAVALSVTLWTGVSQSTVHAAAAGTTSTLTSNSQVVRAACSHLALIPQVLCLANSGDPLQVTLPDGAQPCPNSGAGVACGLNDAANPDVGSASATTSREAGPPPGNAGRVQLSIDAGTAVPGRSVTLSAAADRSVTGTKRAIEIFDSSTGHLVGACTSGSQCSASYAARSGKHSFKAFVAAPSGRMPAGQAVVSSNVVSGSWIGVTASADRSAIAPGRPLTLTVTSTLSLEKTGWLLQVYDAYSHERLTYCANGNTCRMALQQPLAGSRGLVAVLAPASETAPAADSVVAQTDVVTVSWLSVAIRAVANSSQPGGIVHVVASVNAELKNTGWSLGIFDNSGQLVAPMCTAGTSCTADVKITGAMPSFSAQVGRPTPPQSRISQLLGKSGDGPPLTSIQAGSPLVTPVVHTARTLWGVDSCKSFTSGIYPQVASQLGIPDFWGRYLTNTVCPGISGDEIAAAHALRMGILPIYNDYNCSNVVGYDTGRQYGAAAVAAARGLGIPQGVALVIDIEPPGNACPGAANVDGGFVQGWYDGVVAANYVPAYYGNGGAGTAFANAYCSAVNSRPEVANNSQLWTFEPSLWGPYTKSNLPDSGLAYNTHCPEHGSAWQYMLSAGSTPDVDHDLVSSDFPLWYP